MVFAALHDERDQMRLGFIFSLPRAGSTYVQRVLSGSSDVATVPEPWLMPALFGIRKGNSPLSEFAYDHVRAGLDDILSKLDDGEAAWDQAVAAMAQSLYGNFANEEQVFIDKTPRNAAYAPDILRAFPQARVLFLWRNPLAIIASINRTWGKGRWKSYFYHYDLYLGLRTLLDAARASNGDERVKCIRYEDLVSDPNRFWPEIFAHFGAEYSPESVATPPRMFGTMGDVSGQKKYRETQSGSVETWTNAFGSSLRRRWARRYLDWIGADDISFMGYDQATLSSAIEADGDRHWTDIGYIMLAPLSHWIEPSILRSKRGRDGIHRFARR